MKKFTLYILGIITTFLVTVNVYAASGSIVSTTSTRTAIVGSTFTVSVRVSSNEALGSWGFGLSYDNAYISLVSGNTNIVDYGNGSMKSKVYTYKFKAIRSGNAGIRITGPSMVTWNDESNLFTPKISNTTVTVKTRAQIEASYSKDNNLKNLEVEGFELSPSFDKNTTDYKVEVPDNILSIKVNASVNDRNAHVRGIGSIDVSEGNNKIEVVVTAQNGSTKTYTINVEVKDLNPINVDVYTKKYTVVKKAELLTLPTGYTPTTIKINDQDIPGFKSDITNFNLIGLKDESGKIELYIYDEKGDYKKYTELKANTLTLYPVEIKDELKNYKKSKIKINGIDYQAFYKLDNKSIILINAINVENGYKGLYQYDKDENIFIKYDIKSDENASEKSKEYKILILVSLITIVLLILIITVLGVKNLKLKKMILRGK